ncbi:hypothetical protein [Mucilaginibacter antarcticus]|uniref:hypothetical protein n=1 Tax=Mucilaginibacter antarcticus TaxID=1855725 RepID=UPI00362D1AF5
MKRLSILITILLIGFKSSASVFYTDSVRVKAVRTTGEILDSLRTQLDTTTNDTVKASLYNQMVSRYLDYDKLDLKTKKYYQSQALSYTYLALHLYSGLADTVGLRDCFNSLSKVYRSQKNTRRPNGLFYSLIAFQGQKRHHQHHGFAFDTGKHKNGNKGLQPGHARFERSL